MDFKTVFHPKHKLIDLIILHMSMSLDPNMSTNL